jgi:4-amino-4-deoxy-L-arabinose transferase-like glycosyltransferase
VSHRHGDWLFRGGLVAICLVLYLAGTQGQSVFDRDEARFALAVKEMSAAGNWLVPSNWGEPRYNKPILCYWLALASTRVFGMGEAALRLPSALCCVLTVLVTMSLAQRLRGRRAARIAGCAVATALYVVIEARSLTADASLLAATTLSFWAWFRLRELPARPGRWRLVLWTSVGLGLLAKVVNVAFMACAGCALSLLEGSWSRRARLTLAAAVALGALATAIPGCGVLGPVVLGAIVLAFLVRSVHSPASRREWQQLGAFWGIPLALAMLLAWGVPAALATQGGLVSQGVGHHLLGRTAVPFEGHSGWPGYYVVTTLVAFFPWGPLLPAALRNAWAQRQDPGVRFLLSWVLGALVLVELTTSKLPHYMLVTFPALAILVAMLIEARIAGVRQWTRAERAFEAGMFVFGCGAAAAIGAYAAWTFDAAAIRLPAVALSAVSVTIGAAGLYVWVGSRRSSVAPFLTVSAVALFVVLFAIFVPALEPLRLSPRLGEAVARRLEPGERLVLYKVGEASVGFYLPRLPDAMGDPTSVAAALRSEPHGALVIMPDDHDRSLARLQAGDGAVWEKLELVRGVILPSLSERRILIARRQPGAPTPDR